MLLPFGVTGKPLAATSIYIIRGDVAADPVSLYMMRASTLTPDTEVKVTSAASNTPLVIVLEANVSAVPMIAELAELQNSSAEL